MARGILAGALRQLCSTVLGEGGVRLAASSAVSSVQLATALPASAARCGIASTSAAFPPASQAAAPHTWLPRSAFPAQSAARQLHSSTEQQDDAASSSDSALLPDQAAASPSIQTPALLPAVLPPRPHRRGRLLHSSRAALPANDRHTCAITVSIKGFEQRYVKAASTAVQDLLLLNVSPLRAQPPSRSIGTEYAVVTAIAPEQLYFPLGDAGIPQRISRFTVLRSPHVDKKSREQFERRVHKRCIASPPLTALEMRWLLDSIKNYDFPGVQIELTVSSRTPLGRIGKASGAADSSAEAGAGSAAGGSGGFVLGDHLAKAQERAAAAQHTDGV